MIRFILGEASFSNPVEDRSIFVLRDMNRLLGPVETRLLRNATRALQRLDPREAKIMVILTTSAEVPEDLRGHAIVIDYPLPDRKEITRILDDVLTRVSDETREKINENGDRDHIIDAALGLSAEQAATCFAKSIATHRYIDPGDVTDEKKRIIDESKVLTWHAPDPRGLDAVGGLQYLKTWLITRQLALSQEARAYGLPVPRGVLLIGVPGCGKTLTAKAIAAAWSMPLLQLDMGGVKSKYLGESEGNLRRALSVAEAISPCVLWMDEIEKALAGADSSGDGGVAADQLGTVLSWMQEHTGFVFVVATANEVAQLPAPLLRKGRFDEVFFVDLPNAAERRQILATTLAKYGRKLGANHKQGVTLLNSLAAETASFTGSELASVIEEAMFYAFADGKRELQMNDLRAAINNVVPLARTAAEKIERLRKWTVGRARPASPQGSPEERWAAEALS